MIQRFLLISAAILAATSSLQARDRKPPAPPKQVVVLVHGFLDTTSSFDPLKSRLEKRGIICFVPRLKPNDARYGLEQLATRLKKDIDAKFEPKQPISVVAFSMGGLVTRKYLQDMGGAKRCKSLITVSSPHHGTKGAWLYATVGAQEMRPGSLFLTNLAKTERNLGKMPVTSYRTPLDLIILPATNSIWDRAVNLEFPVLLHPLMLKSKAVLADIERRLLMK